MAVFILNCLSFEFQLKLVVLSANTIFLKLCEFFMNLIRVQCRGKKALSINPFEIVYFLPLAEKRHNKG